MFYNITNFQNVVAKATKKVAIAAIAASVTFTSCGKDDDDGNVYEPKRGDVYVAGQYDGKAALWKNGAPHILTDGGFASEAHSVFVSGSDVYVAGSGSKGGDWVPLIWKNGVEQILTGGSGAAYSIFVAGDDVHVAGIVGSADSRATIWKNGELQNLHNNNFGWSTSANSIFVSGSDVYVAGSRLWKNSEVQKFTNGNDQPGGRSVFVSGNDVYVAGNRLWKNGVQQVLEGNPNNIVSVFVSNGDVYVVGGNKVWKNGETLLDLPERTVTNFIYVSGNDVYVTGRENEIFNFWKNGVEQKLKTTPFFRVNSVFVVR